MANSKQVKDFVSQLTTTEAIDLKSALEEKWRVSAAAAVSVVAPPTQTSVQDETMYDVVLTDVGINKLEVIKAVRKTTDLDINQAKAVVESAPTEINEFATKLQAENIKVAVESVGGTVDLIPYEQGSWTPLEEPSQPSYTNERREIDSSSNSLKTSRLLGHVVIGVTIAYILGPMSPLPALKSWGLEIVICLAIVGLLASIFNTIKR